MINILTLLAFILGALLTESWAFMIMVGVVHGEWLHPMPTIGFQGALLVNLTASLFLAPWYAIRDKSS